MLRIIDETLTELIETVKKQVEHTNTYVNKMLEIMETDVGLSAYEIMERLDLKSKENFRKNYMDPALDAGFVKLTIPDKPTSKNQKYYKI